MSKQALPEQEFEEIYSRVPRLCVDVIIKTEKGLLLTLRKEDSWKDMWHIPGGTLNYRERLKDAVKRVAKEELGIDVVVGDLLGYIEYFSEEGERGFGYSVSFEFSCKPSSTDISLDEQAEDVKFFQVLPENIIPEQKDFIQKSLGIF
jgi:ADP-ribose pyrophosphatase YjhB (NUDIX family)